MNSMQMITQWFGIFAIGISLLSNANGSESQKDTLKQLHQIAAMPTLGEGRLEQILQRHYRDGLGGPQAWETVSSLYTIGHLKMDSGDFQLITCRKKPHYMKKTIANARYYSEIISNGKSAWQISGKGGVAKEMEADRMRRFVFDAQFGSHLLYPNAPGKQIKYIDTVPANGSVCHLLQVTLETGYRVEYFINVHTFLIIKEAITDLHTDKMYTRVYSDYSRESGFPIARKTTTYENGKWVSTLKVDMLKINTGMMPWMFDCQD